MKNSRHRLEPACSAEYFVALRSQRYGAAPSSRLDSTKHSGPIRCREFFTDLLEKHHLFVPCLFFALAGVRRSEVFGTLQESVDLDQAIVFIERQQAKMLDATLGLKATKTERRRAVTLAPELVFALRVHLARTRGELLFPHPVEGGPWHFATFSAALRAAGQALGVTISAQRIRRVFSSLGNREGDARAAVAKVMGRSLAVNARSYEDIDLAAGRSVTVLVGVSVSKLLADRGLTARKSSRIKGGALGTQRLEL